MKNMVITIQKDLKAFTHLKPHVQFLLIFQIIILFALSILIGVIFSPKFKKNVENRPNAIIPTEQVIQEGNHFELVAESETMNVGETQTIQVLYQGAAISAAEVHITYDDSVFEITNVITGEAFDTVLERTHGEGNIIFASAQSPFQETPPLPTENFELMTFEVAALRQSQTSALNLITEDSIAAKSGRNILDNTKSLILVVN